MKYRENIRRSPPILSGINRIPARNAFIDSRVEVNAVEYSKSVPSSAVRVRLKISDNAARIHAETRPREYPRGILKAHFAGSECSKRKVDREQLHGYRAISRHEFVPLQITLGARACASSRRTRNRVYMAAVDVSANI